MSEKRLACAGLNFPRFAYHAENLIDGKNNLPTYDLILWILSNFETIEELKLTPQCQELCMLGVPDDF